MPKRFAAETCKNKRLKCKIARRHHHFTVLPLLFNQFKDASNVLKNENKNELKQNVMVYHIVFIII